MKDIRYLKKGDKISLIAPSFGCTTEPYLTRLDVAEKNIEEDGFILERGENIRLSKNKLRSNTARKCAQEFNKAYLESDSSTIISVGGGEIMCEILPYVNFKKIKKAPFKWFMGFSDNTNLTYTLTTICDIPTLYGVNFPAFAYKPYENATKDALDLLMGKTKKVSGYPYWERHKIKTEDPLAPLNLTEPKKLRLYPSKMVDIEGRLLGGCMDVLATIIGTRFDETKAYLEKYKDDGFIWFLEACDLSPIDMQRVFFQFKEAGWFKYCKGFILGRPLCYRQNVMGITHYKAIKDSLKSLGVPLIMDADLGHFSPSMPLITGAKARVHAEGNEFTVEYFE